MKQLGIFLLIGFGFAASAGHAERFQLQRAKSQPPYANISFLVEGPAIVVGQRVVRGKFHRLTVIDSGIVHEAPVLRFDTLTYGDEGCCRRIVASFELPLSEVVDRLSPATRPAYSEFKFRRWDSPTSLHFAYGDISYTLRDIGTSTITVEPGK